METSLYTNSVRLFNVSEYQVRAQIINTRELNQFNESVQFFEIDITVLDYKDEELTNPYSMIYYRPLGCPEVKFNTFEEAASALHVLKIFEVIHWMRAVERGLRFNAENYNDLDAVSLRQTYETVTKLYKCNNLGEKIMMNLVSILH